MRQAAEVQRLSLWPAAALLACWLPLLINFGPTLASDRSFALRDATHYYPQLLQVVHRQWPEQLPLWNPLEERGRPLWADPTAAVLYPGQWIFALPCPFATLYKLYIVGHLLLCAVNSLVAARRLRLDWHAAALVSVSYTLGGSIVFQYCNLPYLIGAAWLPLGAAAVLGVVHGRRRASAELIVVLVLLVLGGDPQAAYLLGATSLIAVALAITPVRRQLGWRAVGRPLVGIVGRLALAGALAAGISAAQWIPTLAWVRASERVEARAADRDSSRESQRSDHDRARAEFSIGPWRWIELLWPNITGRLFPQHERWIRGVPAEGRTWAPSLYMGILPLMLACRALRLRGGRLADRWLTCLVLLGVFASLGRYGVEWICSELEAGWDREPRRAADGVGGLYWLLTALLPGFELFRYPAKLWTWAALGLSLLAGMRLQDATAQQRSPIPSRWLTIYSVVTAVLLLTVIALRPRILALLATVPSDALFGPLATDSAYVRLIVSLAHGGCAAVAVLFLGRTMRRPPAASGADCPLPGSQRRPAMLAWAIVICTAADLTIAGRWMIATVSASAAGPPGLSAAELEAPGGLPPLLARFRSGTWYPDRWAVTTSPLRLAQSVVWDSLTARPKYPMAYGVATLHGATSFSTREQRALLALIDELSIADRSGYRMRGNLSALLRQLGVDFVCLPPEGDVGGLAPVDRTRRMLAVGNDARWMRVLQPLPRVWTVHEAVVAPSPRSESLTDLRQYLHEILLPDGEPRDLRRQVVVKQADAARDPALVAHPPAGAGTRGSKAAADGQCRVERVRASLIRVQVVLDRPGWLIVNESYDPGWRAVVRTGDSVRTMRPLRGNYIMQAIPLPSGEHEVTLRYDPQSVRWGLGVSGISLLAALLATVRIIRRTWNQPRP